MILPPGVYEDIRMSAPCGVQLTITRHEVIWTVTIICATQPCKNHDDMMTSRHGNVFRVSGGCFTNVSRALQDLLSKAVYCRNRTSYENFKLKLCTCAQSMALGTRLKFQLDILNANVIYSIVSFRKIILESSQNVSESTPGPLWEDSNGYWCFPPTKGR